MVKEINNTYMCEICKLHFDKKDLAAKCQAWCSEHDSCNLQITRLSLEAKNKNKDN